MCAPTLLLRAEARFAGAKLEAALPVLEAARAAQPRLDGIAGVSGLFRKAQAEGAPDAAVRRRLLGEARDFLREAATREHKYRADDVRAALQDVERLIGSGS